MRSERDIRHWLIGVVVAVVVVGALWLAVASALSSAREEGRALGRAQGEQEAAMRAESEREQEREEQRAWEARQLEAERERQAREQELIGLVSRLVAQDREARDTRVVLDASAGQPADVRLPLCLDALGSCERARVAADSVISGERRRGDWLQAEVLASGEVNASLRRELVLADSQSVFWRRRGDRLEEALAARGVISIPRVSGPRVTADVGAAWLPTVGAGVDAFRVTGGASVGLGRYSARAGVFAGLDGEGEVSVLPVVTINRVFR